MSKYKVGAYVRLSKDDNYIESDSIDNQKSMIENFIKENNKFELVEFYIDNGYTGTNFDRPAFVQMCFDIAKKKINCVIVKDMSRFGRDSGWVKVYLGEEFTKRNIRFISINDKLDSFKDANYTDSLEFALLNLTYEHYAIDISEKVTAVKHFQQEKGDFIGVSAPFGYLKDPKDCHKFIIDDYAANIVRRIFNMTVDCKSKNEIADILNKEGILTPSRYKSEVTKVTSDRTIKSDKWNNRMINEILKNETYIGTLIQGKNRKPMRKLKKIVKTESKDWKICEDHHEQIIDRETFMIVQNILNFSEIVQDDNELLITKLKCGECHSEFYRRKIKGIYYYLCKSSYRKMGCSLKSIRKDMLENMILIDINDKYGKNYKKLDKTLVNKYVEQIEIYDKNRIEVVYKINKK